MTPAISVTLPSSAAASTIAAELELVLQLVERLAQRLRVGAVERRGEHLRRPSRRPRASARSSPCDDASFAFSRASSFSSAAHRCPCSCAIFCATSSGLAPSARPRASASFASCACTYASAPSPVTASTRRMPAATPLSATILKKPMSPVRATCVPPQSSRELADVEHAHLVAVLLAEQHHRAGFCASSMLHDARARVVRCAGSRALTSASTARISSSVIGALCAKSKRVLRGSTSEPFCWTCAPEHLAQRLVHQVRRRVVAHRARARASWSTVAPPPCRRRGARPVFSAPWWPKTSGWIFCVSSTAKA